MTLQSTPLVFHALRGDSALFVVEHEDVRIPGLYQLAAHISEPSNSTVEINTVGRSISDSSRVVIEPVQLGKDVVVIRAYMDSEYSDCPRAEIRFTISIAE